LKNSEKNIVDTFGRVHNYLRISLTEKCNLRCFYCMPEEGIPLKERNVFMTPDEVVSIAKEFVELGVDKIRLTGGEPLVKKGAHEIIERLGELPITLSLTTNGILVDQFIDSFKKAGIRSVNVSLDSLQEARFNAISRRDYFTKIKANIDLLLMEGFRVKINVVVIKGTNDDEIIDFVGWSQREDIHIQFIEFMPFDGNAWNTDKTVSAKEILQQLIDVHGEASVEKRDDPANATSRNYRIKGSRGSFGVISTITNPFCDTCNRIRLTADGKIKNCLFSNDEMDLLGEFRAGNSLEAMIRTAISRKKAGLGGMDSFDSDQMKKYENRSMIAIGG